LTLRDKSDDDATADRPLNVPGRGAAVDSTPQTEPSRRVIKRYSNRKLYDTRDSRYVTLLQIAEMVRGGEDVQIIDNTTKEDKTEITLALAISEELKSRPRSVPLGTLRTLIQERGEKLLSSLREGPIGRLIPSPSTEPKEAPAAQEPKVEEQAHGQGKEPKGAAAEAAPRHEARSPLSELVASSRHTLDQWQHAIDERIRAVMPSLSVLLELQSEVRKLTHRVERLEDRLGEKRPGRDAESSDGTP
jgi:polyhydroxyalkanoate synthesis repressor PhaR